MSTNWYNSNKNSNYLIILLSLLLHMVLIAAIFFIKPLDKTPEKKKAFDLVELQMGKTPTVQPPAPPHQQPPKTNPTIAKKQMENNQPIKKSVSQTIIPSDSSHKTDSIEKVQQVSLISLSPSAEITTSSTQSTSEPTSATSQGSERAHV